MNNKMSVQDREETRHVLKKLEKYLPGGVSSPVRACKGMGVPPLVIKEAYKDILVDVDGSRYIDYCMSWGACISGHAHPYIIDMVTKRLSKGTSFGCSTELEADLAEQIILSTGVEGKVRFVSSGTEATMTACRLARAYTRKKFLIKFEGNYHGHADQFLTQAGSSAFGLTREPSTLGVPQECIDCTITLPYNNIDAIDELFRDKEIVDNIAAVIVEPIAANMGVVVPKEGFLEKIRMLTKKNGAILIFDEVITGFRLGLGGAMEKYAIIPDITTYGKIIGAGFPLACVVAPHKIMDLLSPLGPVFQAGTLSGNPIATQAGLAQLTLLQESDYYKILNTKSGYLTNRIKECVNRSAAPICFNSVDSLCTLFFGKKEVVEAGDIKELDFEAFAHFFRYMLNEGIYIPPSPYEAWFISSAHSEENLEKTARTVIRYLNSYSN